MSSTAAEKSEEKYEVTLDEALSLAQGHHQAGNYILAERTYRDILKAIPDHYPTTQYLAVLLFQTGRADDAEDYMKTALESDPDDANNWNNFGGIHTQLGNYEQALEAYDKCLEIDPKHLDALNNRAYTLWLLDRFEDARQASEDALKVYPDNVIGLTNLGMALARLEKYDESLEIWQKASDINPEDPRIWANWGNTLREAGKIKLSAEKCRKSVELFDKNPEALNNLANALRDLGQIDEARELYREATNIKPDYYQAHNNLAIALLDQQQYKEAAIAARYAIAFQSDFADGYVNLACSLKETGDYDDAMIAAQKAMSLDPESPDAYLEAADILLLCDRLDDSDAALQEALKLEDSNSFKTYAKLSSLRERQGRIDEALEAIDKALDMQPEIPILWMNKAQMLQLATRLPEAVETMDKALELAPNWPVLLSTKAEMLININENEEAEKLARRAIELNPDLVLPYSTLVSLRKIENDSEEFEKLKSLRSISEARGLSHASAINFALASAYEQFKDYDKAFEHLEAANDFRRKSVPYNPEVVPEIYAAYKKQFTTEFLAQFEGKGFESDVPIFICGMPRSGTTLTEQIISSHPDVYGAGELHDMGNIKTEYEFLPENAREMGEQYVERIKAHDASGQAKKITDKMPGNYANIFMITSILPNAKIIHCRRDPIDTCLSCYKQNFARGQYWSYTLEDLAAEYKRYLDIMEYWRNLLPGRFLEIDYEETVNNFEEQARKLIDFVGLKWDDACLEPHKQKRAVLTASKAQVTRPVYKTSVQKWKKYEKHLQPLVRELMPEEALPNDQ